MAAKKKTTVHVSQLISLADYTFIPGNEGHCPIAAALKTDTDILSPRVNDKKVSFSRRSTSMRYIYQTPLPAARFIRAVDAIVETGDVPAPFKFVLTDADLIRAYPRGKRDNQNAIRQAAALDSTVHIDENGKVVVEPPRPIKAYGHRPKRLSTA